MANLPASGKSPRPQGGTGPEVRVSALEGWLASSLLIRLVRTSPSQDAEGPSPPSAAKEPPMDPRGVKVVVRYADGRFTKGKTYDFQVGRPRFHVFADPRTSDALPVRVDMSDLKAVFFVR